jgi:hypothetical protein
VHNIYTSRGALVRDALNWSTLINAAPYRFGQDAEVMVASHSWPRWGNARIQEVMRARRDMYATLNRAKEVSRGSRPTRRASVAGPRPILALSLGPDWGSDDPLATVHGPSTRPGKDLPVKSVPTSTRRAHSGPRPPLPRDEPAHYAPSGKSNTGWGGGRAGDRAGGSAGSPRASRMALTTLGSITTAITWRRDPHPGHSRLSTENTRDSNMAQLGPVPAP